MSAVGETRPRRAEVLDSVLLREVGAGLAGGLSLRETSQVLLPGAHPFSQGTELHEVLRRLGTREGAAAADWLQAAAAEGAQVAALSALADDLASREQSRSRIAQALAWPLKLMLLAASLWLAAALALVPALADGYASLGANLPVPTLVLLHTPLAFVVPACLLASALAVGLHLRGWLPQALSAAAGRAGSLLGIVRRQRQALQALRVAGVVRAHAGSAAAAAAGLRCVAATTDAADLAAATQRVAEALASGQPVSAALHAGSPALPPWPARYALLGERLGDVPAAIERWLPAGQAAWAEAMVACEQGLLAWTYAVLGTTVGALVLAVYLPIFALGNFV